MAFQDESKHSRPLYESTNLYKPIAIGRNPSKKKKLTIDSMAKHQYYLASFKIKLMCRH